MKLQLIAALTVALLGGQAAADPPEADVDKADPTAKTLPSVASEIAKANAFGAQGERMRAIHQAARAAAAKEAAKAAREAAAAHRRDGAHRPEGRGQGNENARRGLDRAAAKAAGAGGRPNRPRP